MKTTPAPAKPSRKKPKYPTWEHPAGSGIKIAEMPNKTAGKAYGVSYQIRIPAELTGAARELIQRATKTDAERLAEDRFLALKSHGTTFAQTPAHFQKEAALAWGILAEHYDRNKPSHLKLSLLDVVKAGIRVLRPEGGLKSFADVAAELRESKAARMQAGTLDPSTEKDFRMRSLKLAASGLGAKYVSQISAEDITATLSRFAQSLGPRSVLNYRNALSEILHHAKAKQYTHANPLDHMAREDFKKLGGEKAERKLDSINILSVDEARRLLAAAAEGAETGMLATVVLRLFCGLRTGEVTRLDWSEVHWLDARPYVHIPAGKAKKRRIRHVDIPENALAWLRQINPPATGKIDPHSPKTYTRRFGRVAQRAGIGRLDKVGKWKSDWENNDTRHSFGSYHFALHGNALLTAAQMGHKQNDDLLFAHYRTLVRKEQAEAFFALVPETGAEKVAAFPAAAS